MPRVYIDNRFVKIEGAEKRLLQSLNLVSSYKVAGFYFSKAYRAGWWDGYEKLMKYDRGDDTWRAPIGLLDDFLLALKVQNVEYEIVDNRTNPREIEVGWNGMTLRPYQLKAVNRVLAPGPGYGTGILNMPIRSGKTKTGAALIKILRVPTLFVVPSTMLLGQTRKSLEETLAMSIGQIGDEVFEVSDVTVVTFQSLLALKKAKVGSAKHETWKQLVNDTGLIILDECHHLTAGAWRECVMTLNARYRIGLSATAFPNIEKENEKGVIWLKAVCGPVRIRLKMAKLIEDGYLKSSRVIMHVISEPDRRKRSWSQALLSECVTNNPIRNGMIADYAAKYSALGSRIVIVSNRHEQVRQVYDELRKRGLRAAYLVGSDNATYALRKDNAEEKAKKISELIDKSVPIIVGTILSEGVDIPQIEVVIIAEGGKDIKSTIQRLRNLTQSEDKGDAVIIDFMDETAKYFKKHSKERKSVYEEHGGFTVEIVTGDQPA